MPDWQQRLHGGIPLARHMQVGAEPLADGRIRLTAPLAPNINDKGTGFGGSLAALATLAGWVETQRQLDLAAVVDAVDIMVQRGETQYRLPVEADFSAQALPLDPADVDRFIRLFRRKGLARLSVTVRLESAGQVVASFAGDYVARLARR